MKNSLNSTMPSGMMA
eukprot:CCRYP_013073-RC/>CCRYP_013073-RC protein AED:0.47 eAED:0.47 QI:0/-1/0/1/-1/0/1/0/15